jgi:flagellar biosynthesis protein FlhG
MMRRPPLASGNGPLFRSGQPNDQASGLRRLATQRRVQDITPLGRSARVLAVTSGKGGVGKTSVTVNLAILLARWGKRVIVLDCDLGTANVDVMLGLHSRYSLQHVLSRQRRLDEVVVNGPHGIRVIPGGSGLQELANLSDARREELLATFAELDSQADVLLLDTGAGISDNVLQFVLAAGEALVVTTPEPTAVTDAYALIKVANQLAAVRHEATPFTTPAPNGAESADRPDSAANDLLSLRLVVNQAQSEREAQETAANITSVVRRFLGISVEPFGFVPIDPNVTRAIRSQTPVVDAYPRAAATRALERLARRVLDEAPRSPGVAAGERQRAFDGGGTVAAALTASSRPAVPGSQLLPPAPVTSLVRRMMGFRRLRNTA